ncbi:MAG: biotin--[acetyl-CoA-carboxylase] ligase [Clostridia bacterium]|nr:biotin--[acetyl-CoA-carboxylase] ligase [Clostridia bacterium]
MNIEKIRKAKTNILGKNIIFYKEIGSTQDEAKRLINTNIDNGTVILANSQKKGRGTKENIWYTGIGKNIAMTLIIFPNCNIQELDGLTMLIAKCLVSTISELYNYELTIKYPNDLFLNGKKIAGILTETSTSKNKVNHILIGIGFNINEDNFNVDTLNIATSLKREYNKEFSREEIIKKFLEIFENNIKSII